MEVIGILSGKGGVGKTFLTCNLGLALSKYNKEILLIDADIDGANLIQHFNLTAPITLNDVLNGNSFITEAYYRIYGLGLIPSDFMNFQGNLDKLKDIFFEFSGRKDYVLVDGPSGSGRNAENVVQTCDSIILVVEPEITSLTNAYGIVKLCKKYEREVKGIVVNKFNNRRWEISLKDIEEFLENRILGHVPESNIVKKSLMMHYPLILSYPKSKIAISIENIARKMLGIEEELKPWFFRFFK